MPAACRQQRQQKTIAPYVLNGCGATFHRPARAASAREGAGASHRTALKLKTGLLDRHHNNVTGIHGSDGAEEGSMARRKR